MRAWHRKSPLRARRHRPDYYRLGIEADKYRLLLTTMRWRYASFGQEIFIFKPKASAHITIDGARRIARSPIFYSRAQDDA